MKFRKGKEQSGLFDLIERVEELSSRWRQKGSVQLFMIIGGFNGKGTRLGPKELAHS